MLMNAFRRIGIGGALSLAMVGASVQACNPLSPRAKNETVSSVSVAFDPTTLGELASHMKTLQIRVFKVENDQAGGQEGGDLRLAIEQQRKEYTIEKIALGLKDIEISILNEADLALGTGKTRILIKPGMNKTEPVVIKLKKVVSPVTAVTLAFNIKGKIGNQDLASVVKRVDFSWKTEKAAQDGIAQLTRSTSGETEGNTGVSYAQIKPILEDNCVSCHKEGSAAKKLKVDRFPFESEKISDQKELMTAIMNRIQDADDPMPPDDLMAADSINVFKKWEENKFAMTTVVLGANSFTTSIADLRVSDKLAGIVTLYGENDLKLGEKEITPYTVEENGNVSQDIELTVDQPSVVIPVVVEAE